MIPDYITFHLNSDGVARDTYTRVYQFIDDTPPEKIWHHPIEVIQLEVLRASRDDPEPISVEWRLSCIGRDCALAEQSYEKALQAAEMLAAGYGPNCSAAATSLKSAAGGFYEEFRAKGPTLQAKDQAHRLCVVLREVIYRHAHEGARMEALTRTSCVCIESWLRFNGVEIVVVRSTAVSSPWVEYIPATGVTTQGPTNQHSRHTAPVGRAARGWNSLLLLLSKLVTTRPVVDHTRSRA